VAVGHLAPVLGPGELPKLIVRGLAILLAVVLWFALTIPVYKRKATA